jgi:hypothetical protein
MQLAALDDRVVEHVADGAPERLGAVDDAQDGPGGLQAPFAEVGQQVADHGGVLGGALGQAEGDLGAVQGDAQRDHTGVLGHPDAVDQQRHQVQAGQILGQQLGQGMLGGGDEPAGDRRPGGPRARLFGSAADRLQPMVVAAGRQLGQHPLKGELVQQLGRGERLPGRQSQLGGAVGAAYPRPVDPDPAAAEGDPAGLGAMADRGPLRVVAALGADQPLDVGVQQAPQYPQAGSNGKGEQPLAGCTGQLSHRDGDPFGKHQLGVGGQGPVRILRHVAVPFWSSSLVVARHLPHGRHQAGTATSTSTKPGSVPREREVIAKRS